MIQSIRAKLANLPYQDTKPSQHHTAAFTTQYALYAQQGHSWQFSRRLNPQHMWRMSDEHTKRNRDKISMTLIFNLVIEIRLGISRT